MTLHRYAKLGLAGRLALVQAIEEGMTMTAAAAAFSVSPATAHRWCEASESARSSLGCLLDRSSRPHHSPREFAVELQERICVCRRETGWGPRLVAGATGFAHATVSKVLKRAGISRPARPAREPANSYEWPCPGDLLHMDVSRYARFERPGHAVTGDRSPRWRKSMHSQRLVGYDFAHAIVDHPRLAYVELHRDEPGAATVTGFVRARARLLRAARREHEAADDRRMKVKSSGRSRSPLSEWRWVRVTDEAKRRPLGLTESAARLCPSRAKKMRAPVSRPHPLSAVSSSASR
jgi:transposase